MDVLFMVKAIASVVLRNLAVIFWEKDLAKWILASRSLEAFGLHNFKLCDVR